MLSDKIKVLVTQQPGESFLDKMIALVEGATRKKTPNEIALTILLAGFTLVFVIVCITLIPMADYTNIDHPGTYISIAAILSLFVCLIPTTIGGLLSAIGIAGMDRALRANVITNRAKPLKLPVTLIRCCWTRPVQLLSVIVRLPSFIRLRALMKRCL